MEGHAFTEVEDEACTLLVDIVALGEMGHWFVPATPCKKPFEDVPHGAGRNPRPRETGVERWGLADDGHFERATLFGCLAGCLTGSRLGSHRFRCRSRQDCPSQGGAGEGEEATTGHVGEGCVAHVCPTSPPI